MSDADGSPFAPHTAEETATMLDAIGADSVEELFDIPESVMYDGSLGIPRRSERDVRAEVGDLLDRNESLTELLGRGHYDHYQPAIVDDLAGRSEFLTSYTQYQPEVTQGFLQALFEYQSLFVELTGLDVVNCSIYDAATALGEAATLADRVRATSGTRVLVPEHTMDGRRSVLENYVAGSDLSVATYPLSDGIVDVEALTEIVDDETVMIYVETPSVYGLLEPEVATVSALADEHDALMTLGSDPVALSVIEPPGEQGVDVVIGDAATLGLPASYGTGLGLFATSDAYLRQVPGRLVGATTDADDRRAYTLTLQTREQHIRRERATSNICTNQAWVGLRTAMHIAWLGPEGLVDLAATCLEDASRAAEQIGAIEGLDAPVYDGTHFREFCVDTERPADQIAADLRDAGYVVHVVGDHRLQICITDTVTDQIDEVVTAFEEVAR